MPLIKDGREAENTWTYVPDGEAAPDSSITVSLGRIRSETHTLLARNSELGVRLQPDDDPHDLDEFLGRLSLVEISFPKYTDGRGYSQAQLLRRRLRYSGEIRAVGHVLRDQILYMNRSGIDAFETERAELPSILKALKEYSAFYQKAADRIRPVFLRRHEQD